jgi:hypothetical protein
MTSEKSKYNLRGVNAWQKDAARAEYLRHPDASISEVAQATGVCLRTVARARAALVKEGLLPPGRNSTVSGADAAALAVAAREAQAEPEATGDGDAPPDEPAQPDPEEPPRPSPTKGTRTAQTIDGEALRKLNEMLDEVADEDDEVTRKRMLRQTKRFAFDPTLHTDTRMTASQLWAKLLDMARAKDLGPGRPLTEADATARARDLDRACGVKVAVAALFAAFTTEQILAEVNVIFANGTANEAPQPSDAAPAPTAAPGPADDDGRP